MSHVIPEIREHLPRFSDGSEGYSWRRLLVEGLEEDITICRRLWSENNVAFHYRQTPNVP